jgi:hypothetical protein
MQPNQRFVISIVGGPNCGKVFFTGLAATAYRFFWPTGHGMVVPSQPDVAQQARPSTVAIAKGVYPDGAIM